VLFFYVHYSFIDNQWNWVSLNKHLEFLQKKNCLVLRVVILHRDNFFRQWWRLQYRPRRVWATTYWLLFWRGRGNHCYMVYASITVMESFCRRSNQDTSNPGFYFKCSGDVFPGSSIPFFFFCLSAGPAESRRMHCNLLRLIVLTPLFGSPVHLQRRSTSGDVRDLYQRKEELWARNSR
jgi:hypothetical protein